MPSRKLLREQECTKPFPGARKRTEELNEQREVESLMGQISSKFSRIESQLSSAKESEGLMTKVASKFSAVEARLHSATQLSDRVAQLESRLESQSAPQSAPQLEPVPLACQKDFERNKLARRPS